MTPRALIGCETSGVLRRAMDTVGVDCWSCDLLPAEDGSNRHIIGDVRDHLDDGWDLLVIAHPPCTRLCLSGVRWLHVPPRGRSLPEMWADLEEGAALYPACLAAPVPHKAIENPKMHRHARERIRGWRPQDQIVQPWQFGDPAFKGIGLHLEGLSKLVPDRALVPPRPGTPERRAWSRVHRMPPGPDRGRERSRTYPGFARACAEQWGLPLVAAMAGARGIAG